MKAYYYVHFDDYYLSLCVFVYALDVSRMPTSSTVLILDRMMLGLLLPMMNVWKAIEMAIHSHSQYSNRDRRISFVVDAWTKIVASIALTKMMVAQLQPNLMSFDLKPMPCAYYEDNCQHFYLYIRRGSFVFFCNF